MDELMSPMTKITHAELNKVGMLTLLSAVSMDTSIWSDFRSPPPPGLFKVGHVFPPFSVTIYSFSTHKTKEKSTIQQYKHFCA